MTDPGFGLVTVTTSGALPPGTRTVPDGVDALVVSATVVPVVALPDPDPVVDHQAKATPPVRTEAVAIAPATSRRETRRAPWAGRGRGTEILTGSSPIRCRRGRP